MRDIREILSYLEFMKKWFKTSLILALSILIELVVILTLSTVEVLKLSTWIHNFTFRIITISCIVFSTEIIYTSMMSIRYINNILNTTSLFHITKINVESVVLNLVKNESYVHYFSIVILIQLVIMSVLLVM